MRTVSAIGVPLACEAEGGAAMWPTGGGSGAGCGAGVAVLARPFFNAVLAVRLDPLPALALGTLCAPSATSKARQSLERAGLPLTNYATCAICVSEKRDQFIPSEAPRLLLVQFEKLVIRLLHERRKRLFKFFVSMLVHHRGGGGNLLSFRIKDVQETENV